MRKVIDAVTGGQLVMDMTSGALVYWIEELDGEEVVAQSATTDPAKAKRLWKKLKDRVAEKGVGS